MPVESPNPYSPRCSPAFPYVPQISDFGLSRALNIASRITTKTYGTLTHQVGREGEEPPAALWGLRWRVCACGCGGVEVWVVGVGQESCPVRMFKHAFPLPCMTHQGVVCLLTSRLGAAPTNSPSSKACA